MTNYLDVNLDFDGSELDALRELQGFAVKAGYAMHPTRVRMTLSEENADAVRRHPKVTRYQVARRWGSDLPWGLQPRVTLPDTAGSTRRGLA